MGQLLTFTGQPQQASKWCWLAVTASIDAYYSQPPGLRVCWRMTNYFSKAAAMRSGVLPLTFAFYRPWITVSVRYQRSPGQPNGGPTADYQCFLKRYLA